MVNRSNGKSYYLTISFTLAVGLVLNLISYPQWMYHAKPDWVLLILFYWCLAVPHKVGVGVGWILGILLDILHYSLLGQHAIGKAFVALVAVVAHRRIRLYELWQQCIVIYIVASIDIGFTLWVAHLTSNVEIKLIYWQSALTTCLLWPLVYNILRLLRHRKGIS